MDQTYIFLQQYWWVIIALLGGILVFLLFVQGGNSLLFEIGKNDAERKMMINSTGRKWEFTFTTLVTFGASFFASFPLFYSTSFGGAYWLWMIILFTFVLQAVSYEFQDRAGNLVGKKTYHIFLIINGILGPVLLGGAVATFFNGSNFIVDKGNILGLGGLESSSVISQWANASHGLDALLDPWNVALGLAVFFLARVLGILYFINSIDHEPLIKRCRKALIPNTAIFLVSFLAFVIRTLLKDGFAVNPDTQEIFMQSYKYFSNLIEMPIVAGVFLIGVVLVLYGILRTIFQSTYDKGIWFAGFGTVLAVLGLFLLAGFNNTAYYPSNVDIQYSLTIANSSSSKNTLKVMAYASLLMPFVFAYIFYAWRSLNKDKIDKDEIDTNKHMY
ncbi:MAG: cytochrome d ubiquinol oxidase subunit II [Bacteroides sp.]|nr:cytochrome d ubiquinol oxidase subunit II [Bacteroides sp.]MDD2645135.1 cytochrome d ubiquinol oxidase subunit II [Bacteroides sp.]MDD4055011.1 cytochrome d ubiquinol oxidase subunit II [Bacteroides sp.]MDD4719683.1 cytochrome d ubiquinol oxidase subunit II [Bacteroides sp.]NLI63318.1 cytochrome d ubiquinol oxidase subunit II [Bacteroidales bacterium]